MVWNIKKTEKEKSLKIKHPPSYLLQVKIFLRLHICMYHHHAQHHHGNSHRHDWRREAARWAGVWPEPKVNCAAKREVQSGKAWGDVCFFFFFPADPPTWLSANHCQGSRNSRQVLEMCKSENSHGLKRFIGSACGLPESAEIHELSSKAKTTWFHNSLSRTERHMRKNKSRETSNLFLSSDGSFFYGVPLCWLLPPA